MQKITIPTAIFIFLLINIIFNFQIWKEIFTPDINLRSYGGDKLIMEYITEESYQNLIKFKNPFQLNQKILYPFNINISLNDPGLTNSFFFLFLRPLFNSYRSLLIIVVLNILLSNITMYLLLSKLKVKNGIALLVSIIYVFSSFLSHRIQAHYSYTCLYYFPLLFLLGFQFVENNSTFTKGKSKKKQNILLSTSFGIVLALTLYANFYYFFMAIISIFYYFFYFLIVNTKNFINFLKQTVKYFFFSFFAFLTFLLPWIIQVIRLFVNEELVKTPGFGGSIEYSGDLLNFVTPSEYNPFYTYLLSTLPNALPFVASYRSFYFDNWEKLTYPGIIILITYIVILFKKIPKNIWIKIKSHYIISIFFAILTLGPFIKFFGKWFITVDEGINIYFPSLFLLLHYIPGISTIRIPTRFSAIYIFFASIVVAIVLNNLVSKLSKKMKTVLLIILFSVFFIDQFYTVSTLSYQKIPIKAYTYIKNDPEQSTVLEIPFTVRDGFRYIGFVHAISPMKGALIHGKPVIGGYLPRVNPKIFDFYENLPFIGYVARIIDKGNYDPSKEKPKEPQIIVYKKDISIVINEIEKLNIKYVLLKNKEKYTQSISDILIRAEFNKIMTDEGYDLYMRKLKGY